MNDFAQTVRENLRGMAQHLPVMADDALDEMEGDANVFLGLWPQAALEQPLQELATSLQPQYQGRVMRAAHWHITVAYFGRLSRAQLLLVADALADLRWAMPPITLSQVGCFPQANTLWLGASAEQQYMPAYSALQQFHQQVWQRIHRVAETSTTLLLPKTSDRNYIPHVSLLRHAKELSEQALPTATAPLVWRHQSCCLVVSRPQPQRNDYAVYRSYPTKSQHLKRS